MPKPFTKNYEIGKTYRNTTHHLLGAWVGYAGAGFTLLMLTLVMNQNIYATNPIGAAVFGVLLLAVGIALHAVHKRDPERSYTVLRTFSQEDRTVAIEVRYANDDVDIQHITSRR